MGCSGIFVVSALVVAALPGNARAQLTAPQPFAPIEVPTPPATTVAPVPAAVPAAVPPDVVRLRNGGLVRGTIVELVPNAHVTILLVTGDQRRYPMGEVTFAGPAAEMPTAAPPEPRRPPPVHDMRRGHDASRRPFLEVHGRPARLRLTSDAAGLTFHLRTATAISGSIGATGYDEICTAPCEATIPAGTHHLALSRDGDGPVAVDDGVSIHGDAVLRGRYVSNVGIRVGGVLLVVASTIAGGALMFVDTSTDAIGSNRSMAPLIGGVVLMSVGSLLGYLLTMVGDDAYVDVTPR